MKMKLWVRGALFMVFGVALGLVIAEFVMLRGVFGYHGMVDPTPLFVHDDLFGWRFRKAATGVHSSVDFSAFYQINSKGLRDREFPYEKPPGTYRILVLGDSLTEGFGVQIEEAYVKQLETLLNARSGQRVEVINAGVRGYSTDQEYLFLVQEGIKYKPDLVVVAFVAGDQNNTPIGRFRGPKRYYKPFFRLSGTELILDGVPVPNADTGAVREGRLEWLKELLRPSALYAWIHVNVTKSQFRPMLQAAGIMKKPGPQGAPPVPQSVFVEGMEDSGTAYGQEAWRVVRQLLQGMKTTGEPYGSQLMIALVRGDVTYAGVVGELAQDVGVPFLDVRHHPRFREAEDTETIRFQYDFHWNARGHQVVGEIFSDFILTHYLRPEK